MDRLHNASVTIAIVSQTTHLEDLLLSTNPSNEVTLTYRTIPDISDIDTTAADILICDIPAVELDTVLKSVGNTFLVLCIEQQNFALLSPAVKQRAEDIWCKPFDAALIHFRLQKIIHQLLIGRQYRTNQIYLDTLMNNIPDLVWIKDINGIHLKVNNEFCYTVGKTKADIEGYDHYHIWNIDKEEYEKSIYVCLDTDSIVTQSKKPGVFDEQVEGQRGKRQLKTYKSPILDDRGELIGTIGVAQDITELTNMNIKLDLILDSMPFAIMVEDLNGCVLNANQKSTDFFQIEKSAIIGQSCHQIETWIKNNSASLNLLNYEADDELQLRYNHTDIILKIHHEPIYDFLGNIVGKLYIYREITVERNYEEQLKNMAYTDELTGLFTRRYLFECIDKEIFDAKSYVLYIDVDDFKLINDTYGHLIGDEILEDMGLVLRTIFPQDVCVRMGGDEFLICSIGHFTLDEIIEKVNTLLETTQVHFSLLSAAQQLSLSIGIATPEGNASATLGELLKRSDIALYKAKANGKNQYVVYTPDLETD